MNVLLLRIFVWEKLIEIYIYQWNIHNPSGEHFCLFCHFHVILRTSWRCLVSFSRLFERFIAGRFEESLLHISGGNFLIHCTRRNERDISGRARLVAPPFYAQPAVKYYETRHSQLCTCNRDSIRQNCTAPSGRFRGASSASSLLRWPPRTIHRDENTGVKASSRKFFFFYN